MFRGAEQVFLKQLAQAEQAGYDWGLILLAGGGGLLLWYIISQQEARESAEAELREIELSRCPKCNTRLERGSPTDNLRFTRHLVVSAL